MNTFDLHRYPFIRLIIPWMAGVFCGDWFFDKSSELFGSVLVFCLFTCLSFLFYFPKRHSLRWWFGLSVFGLCFMGGWIGITHQLKQTTHSFPEKETVYRVLLTDPPEQKERTFLCRVFLKEQRDSTQVYSVDRKAILYLKSDSVVAQWKGGEELLVSARISSPVNGGNFDEFDYARYLMRKGISGTGYVSAEKWTLLSSSSAATFSYHSCRLTALAYREKVLSLYQKLGFDGDELAVLSALTIGDKTELSESVRESYSVSGASHVLALSGLHIGLLYALFFFLLRPFAKCGRTGRFLRSVFLLLFLWAFAFFTGLSSSVVRSACMFSMLALADLFERKSLSINTLAATAFVMLLCYPVWLFDVGFQLSFLAVAAILLIQKPIYQLFPVKNRIGKYVWGLMSVSIAAQLGTAPLVLLYFSRFSTHFLWTNLVAIPLVTFILYAAVLMLFLTPLPWIQGGVAVVVRFLLKALNTFVRWVEQLPYASMDGIWLYRMEVVGIYIFFLLASYYLMTRRAQNLLICLSFLLLLGTYHTIMCWYDHPQRSLVFYNVRGCPAVHCIEKDGNSWLNYGDTLADKQRLQRVAANYWKRHQLLPPIELASDYQDTYLSVHDQILSFHGCRVCMVTDNRWRNKTAVSPLSIHYLYLCKGYDGHLGELTKLFHPSCIVLDASLSEYRKRLFEDECRQLGIACYSLSVEGALHYPI